MAVSLMVSLLQLERPKLAPLSLKSAFWPQLLIQTLEPKTSAQIYFMLLVFQVKMIDRKDHGCIINGLSVSAREAKLSSPQSEKRILASTSDLKLGTKNICLNLLYIVSFLVKLIA